MKEFEYIINKFGRMLQGKVNTPIVVGGWAINLHGYPRQTIDFDFMIFEEEFDVIVDVFNKLGYNQTVKTDLYARFESESNESYLYFDCLFVDLSTYNKISKTGKSVKIYETEFILPCPMHIIAMKLHGLKYGTSARSFKDFNDIISLIIIYKIDVSLNSELELACIKYGNKEIYNRIVEVIKI